MSSTLETITMNESELVEQDLARLEKSTQSQSFLSQHKEKLFAAALWVIIFIAFFWYVDSNNLGFVEALRIVIVDLVNLMQKSAWGPLIFLLVYAVRPIFLFSAGALSIAGGFLFGPILGILYTIVASNISALVAYMIGRFFGSNLLDDGASAGIIQKYATRMREDSFMTVLTMRTAFIPYDLVNYIAAFLRIDWKPFILATALGSLPGTIFFSLLGASLTEFDGSIPQFDWRILLASLGIFLISLLISRYVKQREEQN